MNYDIPPFNEEEKREYFEQKILDFSKKLFYSPKLAFLLVLAFDILYIYLMIKSRSFISIMLYIFLVYLLISIFLVNILKPQKNE